MPRGWYSYNRSAPGANKFISTFYNPMSTNPVCVNGNTPCAIYAYYTTQPGGVKAPHPEPFPSPGNIRTYLSNIPASLQAQPIGATKKYLYLLTV